MQKASWIALVLLCITVCIGAEQAGSHIIHFPPDRSMGMLYILDADRVDTSSYDDWEPLCEAKGDVAVPAGKKLRLNLSKEAADDLSPLSTLRPDDLTMLYCFRVEIDDDQLRHVSHVTGLEEINLNGTNILGTGLKYFVKLKSLKGLSLNNTHVGDNELAYLSDLPSLKYINLLSTPTGDEGMEHVGKIKSLTGLTLSQGVGNEGLRHLKGLTLLRWLSVRNQCITDEGLSYLAGLTKMETLYLRNTQISDEGLVYLRKMNQLKSLYLSGTRVTEKGLAHLNGLKNLEHLTLPFAVTDVGLEYASQLDSLKSLDINGDSITDKGLAKLTEMKSLDGVSVGGEKNTDEIVGKLAVLPGLKSLSLGRGLTDNGFARLKNIKSLQTLSLNGANISGETVAVLAELPFLRELRILDMNLSGEEYWVSLGKLASLERLDLDIIRSKITDANISHLDGLQSLKVLSMDAVVFKDQKAYTSMDVTDEGLGYLSKLKSLEHLTLHGAKITNDGLQQLGNLDSLKWMDLQGCDVTEEGMQRLKKKLPALRWYL
jgi:internalin A